MIIENKKNKPHGFYHSTLSKSNDRHHLCELSVDSIADGSRGNGSEKA